MCVRANVGVCVCVCVGKCGGVCVCGGEINMGVCAGKMWVCVCVCVGAQLCN